MAIDEKNTVTIFVNTMNLNSLNFMCIATDLVNLLLTLDVLGEYFCCKQLLSNRTSMIKYK